MTFSRYLCALAISAAALPACSSESDEPAPDSSAGSDQLPPVTNGADVEAWLAKGSYLGWHCETTSHSAMKVSPHGTNRVCINDLIEKFTGGVAAERPKNSAAVKELYDDSMTLVGYAVEVKLADTSEGGKNWYWYERVPRESPAPHDANGVVADGKGLTPETVSEYKGKICVACHSGAGADSDSHLVNRSSDFVYDVVP